MNLVFPEQASTVAGRVDALYLALIAFSVLVSTGVIAFVIYFSVKYRRRHPDDVGAHVEEGAGLEFVWVAAPTAAFVGFFFWGASVYFTLVRPPPEAAEVYVTARQWMYKFQHPDGFREINDLHVPAGTPIRLIMGSEDVIHGFFVPAFRVKQDIVPGRVTECWFQATKPGTYWIFCTQYCGTRHAGMIGKIVVMEPADFLRWRAGGGLEGAGLSLAARGERLFRQLGCATCHNADPGARGPRLEGLFGRAVKFDGGGTLAAADEAYIRESILLPNARIVAGYQPIMPTYAGQVTEEQIVEIIAYVKSLAAPAAPGDEKKKKER